MVKGNEIVKPDQGTVLKNRQIGIHIVSISHKYTTLFV